MNTTIDETTRALRQNAVIERVLRGEADALRLVDDLFHLTQIWDDLVDRDREVEPETVSRAFWMALVEIPQNPFYLRHLSDLRPTLRSYFCDWFDANALERGDFHDRTVAFGLRDRVGSIVSQCAYLIGGYDWMRRVSPEIKRLIYDETLDDYMRGLA